MNSKDCHTRYVISALLCFALVFQPALAQAAYGQTNTRKLPAGQVECKEYDSLGRVAKAVDFKGQVTGYEYDGRGLPAYQRFYDNNSLYPDEPELQYEFGYDKSGRRTAVEVNDFEGEPAIYKTSYDAEGKVQYIESPQGFVAYEYHDTTGREKSVRTPKDNADTKVYYYYDSLGRLCEVNVAKRNNVPANESTYYSYSPVGSVSSVLYPNGNYAQYTYDSLNRLTDLSNWQSSARQNVLSSYEYTLSPDGQRTAAAETLAGATTYINWSYDALNRLAAEDYDAPGDANDFTHEYVYDLVGNRLSKTVNDANVTQYSYNDNDQLTEEVTDGNVSSYEYDENGALVKKDAGGDPNHYYSYDLRGKLAQLQVENGVTLNYLYNPDGIRVRAAVQAGSTTDYLIDPYNHTGYAQVFKEVGNANTVYIYGLDAIAQAAGASDPKYLLYDGHGSTRQVSNTAGAVTDTFAYDAYGGAHGFNPAAAATKLLYAGEFFDSHLGFYYNRARYYNPAVGRFNRLDPFAGINRDPQSLHKYLYAHCNPGNLSDPSGQFTLVEALKVVGKVMMMVTVATYSYRAGGIVYKLTSGDEQLVDEAFLEAEDLAVDIAIDIGLHVATFGLAKFAQKSLSLVGGSKKVAAIARFNRNIKYGRKAERYILGSAVKKKAYKTALGTVIPDKVTAHTIKEVKNVKYLTRSKQMRKMVQLARGGREAGGQPAKRLIVYVRRDTKISGRLQTLFAELERDGLFQLMEEIPDYLAP